MDYSRLPPMDQLPQNQAKHSSSDVSGILPILEFRDQVLELIQANGWEGLFQIELLPKGDCPTVLRVRLGQNHLVAPLDIVNDYSPSVHGLEQVQQECLRALRTGRAGI